MLLMKEFMYNNNVVLNPEINIPDKLSTQKHDPLCNASESSDNTCSYSTETYFENAIDLLKYIIQNWDRQIMFDIFNNKQNVDIILFHILEYDVTIKQRKYIKNF